MSTPESGRPGSGGSSGVDTSTVPILEASGHSSPPGMPAPASSCASLQASSPFAAEGLIVIPGGSVTETPLMCAVVSTSLSSSPSCGTFRVTSGPVGEWAR
jgi:hypothetical protein